LTTTDEVFIRINGEMHYRWRARSTNGRAKHWGLKPQQKDLTLVLHRPVEAAPRFRTFDALSRVAFSRVFSL